MEAPRSRPSVGFIVGAVALVSLVVSGGSALLAGCGSDADIDGMTADSGVDLPDGTVVAPGDDAAPSVDAGADVYDACADVAPDADIDCTGKCGPVKDPCTGKVKQCGGCQPAITADGGTEPRVCDLAVNTCIKPKTKCTDLGAECGTVKDSCGNYLDCPDTAAKGCAAGKECDPDTHKCQDCQPVSCKDLGFECGFAFLGCGEDKPENQTDCGGCAAAADGGTRKCNNAFHVCEPSCTPKSAAVLCAEAKQKRGVECGIISNGCGGTVSCDSVQGFGCANGESCGVRGIANRCDAKQTPDECKVVGKNCGEVTSACTGQKVKCGDCPQGQVCNANGVCGAPCAAKTCADFAQFECGTFDDACGSTVTCGNCASGVCDQQTKTCCGANSCNVTYANKCGTQLPNGCGQNALNCACAPGTCTADGGAAPAPPNATTGSCCQPKAAAAYTSIGQCGTNLPNGCGANNVNASCPAGQECVNNANGQPGPAPASGVVGSCCTRTDSCNQFAANTCGPLQNSCRPVGVTTACSKCTNPNQCVANTCCQPAPACAGNGGAGGECNVTKTPVTPGCGSDRTCTCTGGRVCWCTDHVCTGADGAGSCTAALTCASAPYAGKCGTALPNGVGGTIAQCACGAGKVCSTSVAGQVGTCACNNPTGAPYTCNNVPGGPGQGGDACGTFNDGCGSTITCGCTNGQVCNTTPNPNVCCTPAVCPANPGVGTACGTVNNGCTAVNCTCPSGAGNENFQCSQGTCACVKDTCRGRTGPQPDRCGGTLQCGG